MNKGYNVGERYEFDTNTGYVRKCKVIRTSRDAIWLLYRTEKTVRILKIMRKDKKWKERLRKVFQKNSTSC